MEGNLDAMSAVSEQATPCDFNGLLKKNLPHIIERIFLSLDHESFVSCCEVSRTWNSTLTAVSINRKAKSLFEKEISADEKQLSHLSRYGGQASDVRRILLSGLVNVNVPFMWGTKTPIYSAASEGRIDLVRRLLDAKADPNMGAESSLLRSESPFHAAVSHDHFEVSKLLLEKGAILNKKGSPLCWLSKTCQLKMVKLLLDHGADLNQHDEEGYTPLSIAAYHGRADIMKLLLDAGAEPEKTEKCFGKDSGDTPLHTAAGWGNKATIQILLERGAKPNR